MNGFVVQGHISVMLIDLFNQKYSKIVKYYFNLKLLYKKKSNLLL